MLREREAMPARPTCLRRLTVRCWCSDLPTATLTSRPGLRRGLLATAANAKKPGDGGNAMRRTLLILGLVGLAIGLLWIGQGTGAVAWPRSSFMINQIEWAGYGAALSAIGLILIWQSQRP
jgi:hypothetical protein